MEYMHSTAVPPPEVTIEYTVVPAGYGRGLSVRVSCVVPLPLSTTLPLGASHSTVRPSTDSSLSSDTLHTSVYSAP